MKVPNHCLPPWGLSNEQQTINMLFFYIFLKFQVDVDDCFVVLTLLFFLLLLLFSTVKNNASKEKLNNWFLISLRRSLS